MRVADYGDLAKLPSLVFDEEYFEFIKVDSVDAEASEESSFVVLSRYRMGFSKLESSFLLSNFSSCS